MTYQVVEIARIRCGRCKSPPVRLVEVWTGHVIVFDVRPSAVAGAEVRDAEGVDKPGDPDHVRAECACGNRWRLRNVNQITEVDLGDEHAEVTA